MIARPKGLQEETLKKFVAVAFCLVAFGCGDDSSSTPDRATTIAGLTGNTTNGAALYVSLTCGTCHGANGEGTAAGDSLVSSQKSKEEVIDILLQGVSGTTMVGYSDRTDQELADMTAYVVAFQQ